MSLHQADTAILTRAAAVIDGLKSLEGPLLPILHGIQDEFGHVPAATLPLIAEALNLSRAEVHGVVSFYHDYREVQAGRHLIRICRAEACQSMGGEALAKQLLDLVGVGWNDTRADGAVTIEPVYCLGLCACAPAAMVDGEVVGRLDADAIAQIARGIQA